ncbi:nitrogenase component 1 [Fusobacterium nucleatum]|uniref:Oxidoreductase n=1 Tax=Fusobacterium nucleatum subsp. nucleatum (strain ATCC 25586 / DSM 15643 / BCRC 10681 / CIP 101130 / JCM 8532 / KCTC 2640 / LMG 13131 / VPI 4355) TaxID=190304 RepID=A0ABN5J2I0_FUSNN|nr:nitrogenase component 1 [Fusobacterium nucleatum]ALF26702.1 oxidoreductase [Fusobacterium nucleatum subsp. nucleatum]AVQ14782.1 oxidoreductase [Fusobacterium nucleatum subsp. nucleatum ATCC 25586]WMS29622.1 nitrogenase component 1 [Fusobacterium nucleatum]
MNIERCLKNEKNKMLKTLLNIPENIVISIGPTGCLNVLYNEAIKENKLENLYTFPISEIDMVSANHIEKLEKYIVKIISENFEKIKSIIIYLTCADLILVSDFSFLMEKIKKDYGIIVKILERGPIAKRKIMPEKRLEKLLVKLEYELKNTSKIKDKKISDFKIEIQHIVPPITSDYSGACSTLYGENILKILISPSGCKTPVAYDEIRNIDCSLQYSTSLNELEIVTGEIKGLKDNIKEIISQNPKIELIAIISTVVPQIIGMDLESIVENIEETLDIPCVFINTNSFENYYSGISLTLKSLAKKFMVKNKKIKNTVNIIGYSPLTFGKIEKLEELFSLIKSLDLNILTVFSDNLSLEKIKNSTSAELNLVLSYEGLALAKYMEKEFSIPYVIINVVSKYGIENTENILKRFFYKIDNSFEKLEKRDKLDDRKVMIIASPFMAINIADSLRKDFSFDNILALSLIKESRKFKKIEYLEFLNIVNTEDDLKEKIKEYKPDILISDPVYKNLINDGLTFIPLLHYGYSTRLYLELDYEYCGKKAYEYFKKFI